MVYFKNTQLCQSSMNTTEHDACLYTAKYCTEGTTFDIVVTALRCSGILYSEIKLIFS